MEKYKVVDGKITQDIIVEINPFKLKNDLKDLEIRKTMIEANLDRVTSEIQKLTDIIAKIKVDTGIEIAMANSVEAISA